MLRPISQNLNISHERFISKEEKRGKKERSWYTKEYLWKWWVCWDLGGGAILGTRNVKRRAKRKWSFRLEHEWWKLSGDQFRQEPYQFYDNFSSSGHAIRSCDAIDGAQQKWVEMSQQKPKIWRQEIHQNRRGTPSRDGGHSSIDSSRRYQQSGRRTSDRAPWTCQFGERGFLQGQTWSSWCRPTWPVGNICYLQSLHLQKYQT